MTALERSAGGRRMRKPALVSLLAIALLLVGTTPSLAWHHGRAHARVFIDIAPTFWWGAPYWYPPPPPPYYAYPPPTVIVQQPPVYIQQQPAPASSPALPPQGYWYYCPSAKAYYPTVPTCPEEWIKVPPRPQ